MFAQSIVPFLFILVVKYCCFLPVKVKKEEYCIICLLHLYVALIVLFQKISIPLSWIEPPPHPAGNSILVSYFH